MKLILTVFVFILSLLVSMVSAQPTNGLVAYYPFNGNAIDASGNGNNGVQYGTTSTADRFGQAGAALLFDGHSRVLGQSLNPIQGHTISGFTFAAWFRFDVAGDWQQLFETYVRGTNDALFDGLGIEGNTDGLNFFICERPSLCHELYSTAFTLGVWHHFVCTFDGSTQKVYLDGLLNAQEQLTGTLTIMQGLSLGRDYESNIQYFSGALDEVRVYRRALSEAEVQSLYVSVRANLQVTVRDQNGVARSNALCILYDSDYHPLEGYDRTTDSFGAAYWPDLAPGTYNVEAYYEGPSPFPGNEFWCSRQVSVSAGQTTNEELQRNQPYVSAVQLQNTGGDPITLQSPVFPYTPIWFNYTVTNGTTQNESVRIQLIIDRDRSGNYDQGPFTISPQGQVIPGGGTGEFPIVLEPSEPGIYWYSVMAEIEVDGNWVKTDGWAWTPTEGAFEILGYPTDPFTFPLGSSYQWHIQPNSVGRPGWNEDCSECLNHWSDSPQNIGMDQQGKLYLRLWQDPETGFWTCTQVVLTNGLGYGTYSFTLDSRVDDGLDPNVVVGMFTYDSSRPTGDNELDIEFSKWSQERPPEDPSQIGQFKIWGPGSDSCTQPFGVWSGHDVSHHTITWRSGQVDFRSRDDSRDWGVYSTAQTPCANVPHYYSAKAIINIWLTSPNTSPPSPAHLNLCREVVISDFSFTPSGFCVQIPNGGENWLLGSDRFIQWSSVAWGERTEPTYSILLSTDGGQTYPITLAASITAPDHQWLWQNVGPAGSLLRVLVLADSEGVILSDSSNADFTIAGAQPVTDLTILPDITNSDVILTWSLVPGANSYNVYSGDNTDFLLDQSHLLGTTGQGSFVHANALGPDKRFYAITSVVNAGR